MNNDKLSIYISFILRHKPEELNLEMDKKGFVDVEELLSGMNKSGRNIDIDSLMKIVEEDKKNRYSFNENLTKIRANQGHSIEGLDLDLKLVSDVEVLYHGTSESSLSSIMKYGILKQKRAFVHLSKDICTALEVGRRHGEPTILKINSSKMIEDGVPIYISSNNVYLVENVDKKYIEVLSSQEI